MKLQVTTDTLSHNVKLLDVDIDEDKIVTLETEKEIQRIPMGHRKIIYVRNCIPPK